MKSKTIKTISALLVFVVTAFAFASLVSIVNINQIPTYLQTAFLLWIFMWIFIAFLYDLHFKNIGALGRARQKHAGLAASAAKTLKIFASAFYDRFQHLLSWRSYKQALNYLLLPGFIFWASVTIFYLELGHTRIQETFAIISVIALTINFVYIKEVFSRKKERVDEDVFVALSVVKIYAAALSFAAAMGIMRSFCVAPGLFVLAIFSLSFLLMYQALYQHNFVNIRNLFATLALSAILSAVGYYVYIYWNYNYLTAAIFFAAIYNLLWGLYHYHLDQALTRKAFFEILIVCALIAYMVLSVTNFHARILDACTFL